VTFVDFLYLRALNILYDDIHVQCAKGIVIRAKCEDTHEYCAFYVSILLFAVGHWYCSNEHFLF
jgi:hypothetical protein